MTEALATDALPELAVMTLGDLARRLQAALDAHEIRHGEGLDVFPTHARDRAVGRFRWLPVFTVRGGSEGFYVHVERIWEHECEARYELLLLWKGWHFDEACRAAAVLTRALDDLAWGTTPGRYAAFATPFVDA